MAIDKNSNNRNGTTYSSGQTQRSGRTSTQRPHLTVVRDSSSRDRSAVAKEPNNRSGNRKRRRRSKRQKPLMILICILFIMFIGTLMGVATIKNGTEVIVGEKSAGVITGKTVTKDDLVNTVISQLEKERGSKIQLNEEVILKSIHVSKKDERIVTTDYVITKIRELVSYKVEAAVIIVAGVDIAILNNKTEAEELLNGIISEYIPEGSNIVKEGSGFVQEVKTESRFVDSEQIITKEIALDKFTTGTISQKAYTVVSNDTLGKIAKNANMTEEELLEVNSGMDISTKLKVGQQININVSTPFLSVKTAENTTYTEKIVKKQEIQYDDTKSSSYKKVVQQGKDGQQEVTSQIIRVNGFEQEKKVISTNITVAPINEVIVIGTK